MRVLARRVNRIVTAAVLTLTVLTACSHHASAAGSTGTFTGSMLSDGVTRTYVAHVPSAGPYAGVVINMHGSGGSGADQERITKYDTAADRNKLVVIYPDGINNEWADHTKDIDVNFVTALAQQFASTYGVSAGHIFATGHSRGGFMSNRLGCERSDVFAAIAPVSGTMYSDRTCAPAQKVSVLDAHGTADPVIPYNGGSEAPGDATVSGSSKETEQFISAPALVAAWRSIDQCGAVSAPTTYTSKTSEPSVSVTTSSCASGTAVDAVIVNGGGHTWPGGIAQSSEWQIGKITDAYDFSEASAEFFVAHGR